MYCSLHVVFEESWHGRNRQLPRPSSSNHNTSTYQLIQQETRMLGYTEIPTADDKIPETASVSRVLLSKDMSDQEIMIPNAQEVG